ncbi:hypothetical protein M433DRAFT_4467 [Acidomyces richmondensis BFW]|nr:MAG: hypothetical protein FE78DRAFT_31683 [Acidomyces sp. 'richmondensis']KYG45570.1 hypothetical protein M433DRAFT_4467 [Acidomyces richmondensis BFW]
MAQPPPQQPPPLATKLIWLLGLPTLATTTWALTPRTLPSLPFILTPTLGLLYQHTHLPSSHAVPISELTTTYWATGTLGLLAVSAAQAGLVTLTSRLLFSRPDAKVYFTEFVRTTLVGLSSDDLALRARLARSGKHFVFLALFSFLAAGGTEEILKFLPIAFLRRRRRRRQTLKKQTNKDATPPPPPFPPADASQTTAHYLQLAIAAGLGFSMFENLAYAHAMAKSADSTPTKIMLTVLERMVFGTTGHVLTACLTAVNAARYLPPASTPDEKVSSETRMGNLMKLLQILGPSILYHGLNDFQLFALCAWEGNVGWIHPTEPRVVAVGLAAVMGLQGLLAWDVWKGWRENYG